MASQLVTQHHIIHATPKHPVTHAQYVTLGGNNRWWNCVEHEECVDYIHYKRVPGSNSDEFWLIIINSAGVGGSGREQQILGLSGIYPGEINSDLAYTGSKDQPHRLSSKYLTRLRVLSNWNSASNFKDSSLLLIGIVWSLSGIFRCVLAVFVFGCNRLECDYSEYSPVSREGILIKFQLQQIVHQIGSGPRDACS